MVVQNPQHIYHKNGVYYYCRRVPKDLLFKYDENGVTKKTVTAPFSQKKITTGMVNNKLAIISRWCLFKVTRQ